MKKLLLTGIIFALSMSAKAAMLTYELYDAAFDDGATASGSFDWSSQDGFANISITTTASQLRNYDVTYTTQVTPGVLGVNFGVTLSSLVGNDTWSISFEPSGPIDGAYYLTNTTNRPDDIYKSYSESAPQNRRYVVSGYVAPVPIPAALWLFGTSVFGLCLSKRRTWSNC
jgi:hypothetical protein